jgi:hypothetical protein
LPIRSPWPSTSFSSVRPIKAIRHKNAAETSWSSLLSAVDAVFVRSLIWKWRVTRIDGQNQKSGSKKTLHKVVVTARLLHLSIGQVWLDAYLRPVRAKLARLRKILKHYQ